MWNTVNILVIICVLTLSEAEDVDPTLVTLPCGQIRGRVLLSPNDNVYYAFQEVPYAAPPVGKLRFKPPVEPRPWSGVLNTTQNTKICYQRGFPYVIPDLEETEDCLYLNVYTPLEPGNSSRTPLPVLVWIHGGGFESGTGTIQLVKPDFFIDYGIVVVTINYRLGPLGFLTTVDDVIPGNIGLKDQHFAIKWVKKNINLFGGDPERIIISGHSAGAASVGLQLISPQNAGLFQGAILQSGTGLCQWSHQNYARYYAFEVGRYLNSNFTSDNSSELLTLLQSVPATDINNNNVTPAAGKETGWNGLIWLPVIEDENTEGAFLTRPFHEDVRTGNINKVPILLGFNSEEQLSFMIGDPSIPQERAFILDNDLSRIIGNKFRMTPRNKVIAGRELRRIYTKDLFQDDPGAIVKFFSDDMFSTPIIRHAKLQSRYTDVYLYQFSYKGRMGGYENEEVAGVEGVGHGEDIVYLWDSRLSDGTPDDPADVVIRHQLLTLWSNFVKHLNPTPEEDSFLGNVTWKTVTPRNLLYLHINDTLEIKRNPKEYLSWERIVDRYAIPPLVNY